MGARGIVGESEGGEGGGSVAAHRAAKGPRRPSCRPRRQPGPQGIRAAGRADLENGCAVRPSKRRSAVAEALVAVAVTGAVARTRRNLAPLASVAHVTRAAVACALAVAGTGAWARTQPAVSATPPLCTRAGAVKTRAMTRAGRWARRL